MILDGCFWLRLFRTESSSLSQVPGVSAPVEMVGLQGEKKIENKKNRTPINILVEKNGCPVFRFLFFVVASTFQFFIKKDKGQEIKMGVLYFLP